jgi:hypothetical protein
MLQPFSAHQVSSSRPPRDGCESTGVRASSGDRRTPGSTPGFDTYLHFCRIPEALRWRSFTLPDSAAEDRVEGHAWLSALRRQPRGQCRSRKGPASPCRGDSGSVPPRPGVPHPSEPSYGPATLGPTARLAAPDPACAPGARCEPSRHGSCGRCREGPCALLAGRSHEEGEVRRFVTADDGISARGPSGR